ncbi:MAG: exodeoxyribonuclease V subunit alpha [Chlamydiales bacterium]|nr:exodeoxyribonuclease V subunit alpha [Chlamydiales bacterium]
MPGIAQKLFLQRKKQPIKISGKWPLLQRLVTEGSPLHLELALANDFVPEMPECVALFMCHLVLAAKQGHLCVSLENGAIRPCPVTLWSEILSEQAQPLPSNLTELIVEGANGFPIDVDESWPVLREGSRFYLRRYWNDESVIVEEFKRLVTVKPRITVNPPQLSSLNDEQKAAVIHACSNSLTFVTGGPGTGKTYTAGCLVDAFGSAGEVIAAAPTGKAASNLSERLGRAGIKAKTLHSLLGLNKKHGDSSVSLTADLIIVDECSMIDAQMMASLLRAVKTGARLVLLGDSDQLPSIEAGGIFADLAHAVPECCVCLQKCLRTESTSILNLAAEIRQGKMSLQSNEDIVINPWPIQEKQLWNTLVNYCQPLFNLSMHDDPEKIFSRINQRRILTPLREGPWGVTSINERLVSSHHMKVIPIMVTVNDYSQELFNGDVGLLVDRSYALFKSGQTIRRVPVATLPRYEYAFALSVHKSQGSEFDHVMLLLPPRSEAFGREILYTAVTRARKGVEIVSSTHMLETLLQRQMTRLSGIQQRLL